MYIEYHKFFPSFTNSAPFLRPLCFQLNKCIFNRTSCSPPKWEEFLFFAWSLWWRTGEGLEQIVARMLVICAHRSILPGATWQLILCSFEVLYFCGFDSIKSPAHVVINTSCLNVSRSLQAFVAFRYNFERLSTETKTRSCNYGSFWSLHHKLCHGTREYFHISVSVNMSMSTAEKDRVINELPKVSRMVNFYSQVINMTKFKRIWNILSQCRGMTISQVTVGN